MKNGKLYQAAIYQTMSSKLEKVFIEARNLSEAKEQASLKGYVQYVQTFEYVDEAAG